MQVMQGFHYSVETMLRCVRSRIDDDSYLVYMVYPLAFCMFFVSPSKRNTLHLKIHDVLVFQDLTTER